jgi:predicted amidohydrolase YtcJ
MGYMGEIWYGGTIYTVREENEKVDAVYIENGTIVDVGSKEELENQYFYCIKKSTISKHGAFLKITFVQ